MKRSEILCSLILILCLYPRNTLNIPDQLQREISLLASQHPELFGCPISINDASKEQLMTLPQIGESRAEAIVHHRALRPFKHRNELMMIKGIGQKRLEQLKPLVVVSSTDCLPFVEQLLHEEESEGDKRPEVQLYLGTEGVARYR